MDGSIDRSRSRLPSLRGRVGELQETILQRALPNDFLVQRIVLRVDPGRLTSLLGQKVRLALDVAERRNKVRLVILTSPDSHQYRMWRCPRILRRAPASYVLGIVLRSEQAVFSAQRRSHPLCERYL